MASPAHTPVASPAPVSHRRTDGSSAHPPRPVRPLQAVPVGVSARCSWPQMTPELDPVTLPLAATAANSLIGPEIRVTSVSMRRKTLPFRPVEVTTKMGWPEEIWTGGIRTRS